MSNLCSYRNIFGEPKKGVHSYRIFDVAIVDVISTVVAAWFISHYLKISFFDTCIILFILGILLHHIFCVETTIDKFIFG